MAKVHPRAPNSSSSRFLTSKQETFTIWMKSLVLNGKGCTVFDSEGDIVYRVDNYNCKCRDVYLMDFNGEVLFTIHRKEKYKVFRFWEGYRSTNTNAKRAAGFQVRKSLKFSRRGSLACEVVVVGNLDNNNNNNNQSFCYNIEKSCSTISSKDDHCSPCKIVDKFGRAIAEVKRKQSKCGVLLGDDVLTMVVEPSVDHCLIMGLFVVYSLINSKM